MLLTCNIWHLQWLGMCLSHTSHTGYPDGDKMGLHPQAGFSWSALAHALVCWLINKTAKGECPKPELRWSSNPWLRALTDPKCICKLHSSSLLQQQPGASLGEAGHWPAPHQTQGMFGSQTQPKRPADIVGVSQRFQKSPDTQLPRPNAPQTFTCGPHKACLSQKKRAQRLSKDY